MKRILNVILVFTMIFSVCLLSACTQGGLTTINEGKESTELKTEKSPLELTAKEVFLAFIDKVSKFNSYEINASGSTTTKIAFISVSQNIKSATIKNGDEYYSYNKTESTFVKTNFCAFFKGGVVAYDKDNCEPKTLTVTTDSEYKQIYGILPYDKSLNGFMLNNETIVSAEKISENADDTITYQISLDGNKAGANVQRQMKEFGGLNTYPDFKKTNLTLVIKKDWTPVSLTTDYSYVISASFVSNATCSENVVYSYSKVNESVSIPNRQAFIDELEK